MTELTNRYDFVLLVDVENGNPNGDPDAGNMPRIDDDSQLGLITDASIKRKLRNYVQMAKGDEPGFEIYMAERGILNLQHQRAYDALGIKAEAKKLPRDEKGTQLTDWMTANFWDIRTFGAVMTTEVNVGHVRGPLQIGFGRSVEPITPMEITITRSSVTNESAADKERTMGRKHIVPYGLYMVHGFVNAPIAKQSGFSEEDLELVWAGLRDMFDLDRSAARGMMASRRLVVFKHDSALGNAQAHKLFDRISIKRSYAGEVAEIDDPKVASWPAARRYKDYEVTVDTDNMPSGVSVFEPF